MSNWSIEQNAAGHIIVRHLVMPRFTARWTTGDKTDPAERDIACWTANNSGGDDRLHIFGFQWQDSSPAPLPFERLMQSAATAIDAWISSRM